MEEVEQSGGFMEAIRGQPRHPVIAIYLLSTLGHLTFPYLLFSHAELLLLQSGEKALAISIKSFQLKCQKIFYRS